MNAARWEAVKSVFDGALRLALPERAAFVERACGTDDVLRKEVESLLAMHTEDENDSLPIVRDAIAAASQSFLVDEEARVLALLGEVPGHQFDIVRLLGRGGMGTVYLAREHALDRLVAIKVLRPDLALAPDARERFRREARIAAQLTHPHILRLHTFGEVGGLWYFVMGYVRGPTLADRVRREGRLPWPEAHRVLTELAGALECAHRLGVVHRDIKPANILLDEETGHAVLADFGISKARGLDDSLTAPGAVIGTPDFMSPEQARGYDEVDERSDIYSLGAVAYTMLSGREPYAGVSTRDLAYRFLHDPAPLRSIEPSVPEPLAAIVMRCLARDASARWPDARALKLALDQVHGTSTETLPHALRELPTFGPYALLWAAGWTAMAVLLLVSARERALLLLIALLVPVGLLLHVWNVGPQGLGLRELARIAYWPPEWWGMWWPRTLRQPSDLWTRLPWMARFVRGALSFFFLAVPVIIGLRHWLVARSRLPVTGELWFALVEGTLVVGTAAIVTVALAWTRQRGLTMPESVGVLFGSTLPSPAWAVPRVAHLLAPVSRRVRSPEPGMPSDYQRAIAELLPLLPADVVGACGVATATSARLLRAIGDTDRELESLARDVSGQEVDRLSAQLTTLGDPVVGERVERRELRDLVRHQLELVRRMRNRYDVLSQQRGHFLDQLRAVWTLLSAACDACADRGGTCAEEMERMRSHCGRVMDELEVAFPAAGMSPDPARPENPLVPLPGNPLRAGDAASPTYR